MASLAAGRAPSVGAIDNFVNLDGARPAWGLVLIASTLRDCPNRGSFGADFDVGRLSYRRLSKASSDVGKKPSSADGMSLGCCARRWNRRSLDAGAAS